MFCGLLLDTVTNGYVSQDSQLPTSDNVVVYHDVGSPVHLSNGTCSELYTYVIALVQIEIYF